MYKLLKLKKQGSAIPLAVVAVIILLAMGVGLLGLGLNSRIFSIRTASDIAARCAADAGLAVALFEMNEKLKVDPWDGTSLPEATNVSLPNCDEVFSYKVISGFGSNYIIKSIGESGGIKKVVYATIGLQGLFEHAILTKQTLTLKSGTVVDGYNSLDLSDTDIDVDIGTQSTSSSSIILNSGVTVKGDVVVGVGGNPDTAIKDLGATTGDKYAATAEDPLPQVTPPTLPNMGPAINIKAETVTITPEDNGQYGRIVIKQGSSAEGVLPGVLEVSGGDVVLYITGDIELGEECEIVVAENSTLTLYVDGDIHSRANSGVNTKNPPEKAATFKLYATGEGAQDFDIKAKSEFTGVIYAPNADVDLYANGDAYGSVIANSFEFKAGGNYHYDEALREVKVDDEGVRFVVKRWSEGGYRSLSVLDIEQIKQKLDK